MNGRAGLGGENRPVKTENGCIGRPDGGHLGDGLFHCRRIPDGGRVIEGFLSLTFKTPDSTISSTQKDASSIPCPDIGFDWFFGQKRRGTATAAASPFNGGLHGAVTAGPAIVKSPMPTGGMPAQKAGPFFSWPFAA
jgi:hypothetical protein